MDSRINVIIEKIQAFLKGPQWKQALEKLNPKQKTNPLIFFYTGKGRFIILRPDGFYESQWAEKKNTLTPRSIAEVADAVTLQEASIDQILTKLINELKRRRLIPQSITIAIEGRNYQFLVPRGVGLIQIGIEHALVEYSSSEDSYAGHSLRGTGLVIARGEKVLRSIVTTKLLSTDYREYDGAPINPGTLM